MTKLELLEKAIHASDRTAGNETQYTISSDADTVYLAIQGSVQKQDWKFNFMFWVAPYKNMPVKWYVHKGFAEAWKLSRDQITSEVLAILGDKKLVILGYSHGAALALLAHEFFIFAGMKPETTVYGCPRVLWMPRKQVRNRFVGVTQIKRRGDLVTTVPFAWMGYRHAVKQTLIGRFALTWWKRHLIPEYKEALQGM